MTFKLKKYIEPDFTEERFISAPNVRLVAVEKDGVAPDNFHALSIFPEYFKVDGKWYLAEDSRMDAVPVFKNSKIEAIEARRLEKGDLVVTGKTEGLED